MNKRRISVIADSISDIHAVLLALEVCYINLLTGEDGQQVENVCAHVIHPGQRCYNKLSIRRTKEAR